MTNPRDPEGLMPDADVTGGPESGTPGGSPFEIGAQEISGADPLAGRTDLDEYGSDPDVRFPGESEDPPMSTADATANATQPPLDVNDAAG